MSSLQGIASIGQIAQLAFVPDDFNAAVEYWTGTVGVGPFLLIDPINLTGTQFDGQASAAEVGVALAYWGDMQIELIKQHNDAPSIYINPPWGNRQGIHHYGLETDDIAAAKQVATSTGGKIIYSGFLPGGAEFFFVETVTGQPLVEVIEQTADNVAFLNKIKDLAANWDGSDPLRTSFR